MWSAGSPGSSGGQGKGGHILIIAKNKKHVIFHAWRWGLGLAWFWAKSKQFTLEIFGGNFISDHHSGGTPWYLWEECDKKCELTPWLSQPRSQGLSSLPPLVVGRKTLVATDHMTTQNLGGKKICWVGGVAEYFVWLMWKTLWVSNPLAVSKNYSLFRGSKSNLPMMNASWFLPSSKYRRLSFAKKFGSRMEQKLFDGYAVSKCERSMWNKWISRLLNLWMQR